MRPLAIIDSDAAHGGELQAAVEAEGFHGETFTSASAALARLRTRACALVILDLDVRDTDPYAVCREVSAILPVIAMARDCGAETCVRALEVGADDCIVRTTSAREVVARIRSVLRRTPQPDDAGPLAVSLSAMRVRAGEVTHNLTRGETELLAVLIRHSPTPVPITRLTQILGAPRNTVESQIKSLRRKLGAARLVSRGSLGYQVLEE